MPKEGKNRYAVADRVRLGGCYWELCKLRLAFGIKKTVRRVRKDSEEKRDMRYAINKWRTAEKDISDAKMLSFRKAYYKHLNNLELIDNSALITYFAMPFFHDSVLTRFETDSWKNEATIEIVRQEADLEDINDWRTKTNLPKISEPTYMKKPIIYRFHFKNVMNTRYSFSGKHIKSFWIMGSEIDKQGPDFRLTIEQDIKTEMSITFRNCNFALINSEMIMEYTDNKLKTIPYCATCKSNMTSIQKIRKAIE